MEALGNFLGAVFTSDIGITISVMVVVLVFVGFLGWGLVKLLAALKDAYTNDNDVIVGMIEQLGSDLDTNINNVKRKLESLEEDLTELAYIEKDIQKDVLHILKQLEHLRSYQEKDARSLLTVKKDIEVLLNDTKNVNSDLARQLNDISRDLSNLYGTIVGMSVKNRTSLK